MEELEEMNEVEANNKEQTFAKLTDLQHMMGAYHHKTKQQHGPMADASRGRGRVLALLKMKDGIATKDMANVLDIRVSSLNETLGRLEKDGYVERRPSEDDGRIMLVYLTEKGAQEEQPQADLSDLLFADFDDEAIESLSGHLDLMTAALEKELGEDWREQHENARHSREKFFKGDDHDHGHGPRGGHGGGRGGRGGFGGGHGGGGHGGGSRGGYGQGGHGGGRGGGHGGYGRDGAREGGHGHGGGRDAGGRGGYGNNRGGGRGGQGKGGNPYATRYDLHE